VRHVRLGPAYARLVSMADRMVLLALAGLCVSYGLLVIGGH
jgi:hypothetical protein